MRVLLVMVIVVVAVMVDAGPVRVLEGAVMINRFDYVESVPAPLKSTEDGVLTGVRVVYGEFDDAGLHWRGIAEYTDGRTDFDGTDQQGTPILDTSSNTFITVEGDLRVGTVRLSGLARPLVLYTGLGWRSWDRRLGGPVPYSEAYRWAYMPLGVRGEYVISDAWSGAFDLAMRAMINGDIQFNFSEIDPAFNNPSASLGNRIGARLELPFTYHTGGNSALVLMPWYEYSAIGESNTVPLTENGTATGIRFLEPSSRTHQFGANVGARWAFE